LDAYKVALILFMHNIFSVQFQNLISCRNEQEVPHPTTAESGVYTGKHILALQQSD